LNRAPEALLLDALGTLVALEPPAPRLQRVLSSRFGLAVSDRDAERAIAAEIAYYRSHFDEGRDFSTLAALRRRCAEAMGAALPSEARARLDSDELLAVLLESLEFSAFGDVRPALDALRNRNVRLVVLSNWDVSLANVLERVGLAMLFDGIVTSSEVGARKPAAAIFQRALDVAGITSERAVHVGDSVLEDVEGARAAGIDAVLLRRDGRPGPAGVTTVPSLTALVVAFDGLSQVAEP
jgi:putative hydrolase of the HAD superfamily